MERVGAHRSPLVNSPLTSLPCSISLIVATQRTFSEQTQTHRHTLNAMRSMCLALVAACAAVASAGSVMGVVDDVVKVRDAKGDVVGVVEELRLIPLNEHKGEKVVPPQQDDTKAANSNPPADILPGVPTPTDDNFTVLPLPPRDPNETVVLPPPPVKDDNGECCCAFHYCVLECAAEKNVLIAMQATTRHYSGCFGHAHRRFVARPLKPREARGRGLLVALSRLQSKPTLMHRPVLEGSC